LRPHAESRLEAEAQAALLRWARCAVLVAYGLIRAVGIRMRRDWLLNMHASILPPLPRRGADPAGDHGRRP